MVQHNHVERETTLRVLCLYNATQTYTNTVFDHLNSFATLSKNQWHYRHYDRYHDCALDLSGFDVVVVHYSIRLCYLQIGDLAANSLGNWQGTKALFIQDEYDSVSDAKQQIRVMGFNFVFTAVPEQHITTIYPPQEFPRTRFINVLTGYVSAAEVTDLVDTVQRPLFVGYRGRDLSFRYGSLAIEKFLIGEMVKQYCVQNGISCDIEMAESKRIYGRNWSVFLSSCRSTLGTESGSNVFDWDGTLENQIGSFKKSNPDSTDHELFQKIIVPKELDSVMNQISPKLFEAISCRTLLILFEGSYSQILSPWYHYIPLSKDGSNINQVMKVLNSNYAVTEIVDRAYSDIISSNSYSYQTLVNLVDSIFASVTRAQATRLRGQSEFADQDTNLHRFPRRFELHTDMASGSKLRLITRLWRLFKATNLLKRVVTAGPLGTLIKWWQN